MLLIWISSLTTPSSHILFNLHLLPSLKSNIISFSSQKFLLLIQKFIKTSSSLCSACCLRVKCAGFFFLYKFLTILFPNILFYLPDLRIIKFIKHILFCKWFWSLSFDQSSSQISICWLKVFLFINS